MTELYFVDREKEGRGAQLAWHGNVLVRPRGSISSTRTPPFFKQKVEVDPKTEHGPRKKSKRSRERYVCYRFTDNKTNFKCLVDDLITAPAFFFLAASFVAIGEGSHQSAGGST